MEAAARDGEERKRKERTMRKRGEIEKKSHSREMRIRLGQLSGLAK
jgi:hypothetical protein